MCGKVDVGGRGVTKIIVFVVFNNKDNVITFLMIALRKFLIANLVLISNVKVSTFV